MLKISCAGTGAILGVPVIVGSKDSCLEVIEMSDLQGISAGVAPLELLTRLGVQKDEEIVVSRGRVFAQFCHEAKRLGYTNIVQEKLDDATQDAAEGVFMDSLYSLGMARSVALQDKDYEKLYDDMANQLYLQPALLVHVRPHFAVNPRFTKLLYRIDRLTHEFPHLYSMMLEV